MAAPSSPTVRRWELAARLRKLRTDASLTIEDVAERLMTSTTKISRLETGDRPPQLRDVRDLCDLFKVSDEQRTQLMELARLARERGWWQQYGLNPATDTYAGLEASALTIHNWEPSVVPGLLQTQAYAEAVLKGFMPTYYGPEFDTFVDARAERQKRVLGPDGQEVWAIVDEAGLRRLIGGAEVMREQWNHLLEVTESDNVNLQYLPYKAGAHPGIQGPFVVLEFEPEIVGDVVYSEGMAGQYFMEKKDELTRYRKAFDQLRAAAEGPDPTRNFIRRLLSGE